MKSSLIHALLACLAITICGPVVFAANNNSVTYNISEGSGGFAVVDWSLTGGMLTSGVAYNTAWAGGVGFNGILINASGIFNGSDFSYNPSNLSATDGSAYVNLTSGVTNPVNSFVAIHSTTDSFGLAITPFDNNGTYVVAYQPGSGRVTLPVLFSSFNVGNYSQYYPYNSPFSGTYNATINVIATVPEPSTYALFGLGALGLVIAYRRRRA